MMYDISQLGEHYLLHDRQLMSIVQAYSRGTDDEDHLSQGTSPSYSSVAPLGLPAGDAGAVTC